MSSDSVYEKLEHKEKAICRYQIDYHEEEMKRCKQEIIRIEEEINQIKTALDST